MNDGCSSTGVKEEMLSSGYVQHYTRDLELEP
jgi:hypothetical protein